jgi:hypothetical protein
LRVSQDQFQPKYRNVDGDCAIVVAILRLLVDAREDAGTRPVESRLFQDV